MLKEKTKPRAFEQRICKDCKARNEPVALSNMQIIRDEDENEIGQVCMQCEYRKREASKAQSASSRAVAVTV